MSRLQFSQKMYSTDGLNLEGINADGSKNVQLAGSKSIQEMTIGGISVAAGATTNCNSNPVDLRGFRQIGSIIFPNTSHNFTFGQLASNDGIALVGSPIQTVSKAPSYSASLPVISSPSDFIVYQITNSDTISHTYNVYSRKII